MAAARGDGGGAAGAAEASPDVAALYRRQDLSLKDGETLKCGPLCAALRHSRCSQPEVACRPGRGRFICARCPLQCPCMCCMLRQQLIMNLMLQLVDDVLPSMPGSLPANALAACQWLS